MDYEKKYNEALERAKDYFKANQKIGELEENDMLSDIFPELKESEDERIRKGLIEYFKDFRLGTFAYLEPKKILAWLEKQKEFVSADFDDVWETADCNELTAPLEKYSKDAIKEMCHAWYDKGIELERKNWLEKQGEHSVSPLFTFEDVLTIQCAMAYAKFQDRELNVALKKLHDKVYDAYHDSKNHHIESQDGLKDEQKPVPKFEVGDVMRTLQEAADNITSGLPVVVSIDNDNEYYRCTNELIAIKDQDDYEYPPMNRIQKPSWKPSEEDEKTIDIIISFLEEFSSKDYIVRKHCINWLKSLKDGVGCEVNCTTTWNPSDEQIGALEHFVRSITESGFASPYDSNTKLVYSLLNDLKKLKL